MTTLQNSTLIYDNCSTLLSLTDELQRYSPILPPKAQINQNHQQHQHQLNNNNDNNNNKNNNENINHNDSDKCDKEQCNKAATNNDDILQKLRAPNRKKYAQMDTKRLNKQQQQKQKQLQKQKNQQHRAASSCGGRSISLYGVNSTVEQGHKEIPIWVGNEPRYVSGVTMRTTCNDIIKALIDDEIRNGNPVYCGTAKVGAASRDCSDYVITESWRGIERSYDGNMAILPVWKAWSRVHNELRLSLKHHKEVPDPSRALMTPSTSQNWFYPLRKYLQKLFKLKKHHTSNKEAKLPTTIRNKNCLLSPHHETADEILFVILPDKIYEKAIEAPAINPPQQQQSLEAPLKSSLLTERLYRLSETRASTRKHQRSRNRRKDGKTLEKRRISPSSNSRSIQRRRELPSQSALRQQLAKKTSAIDELYQREYALTKELTNKCKLYKLQNELYTHYDKHLELSVGQVQRNVEAYAEQIIKTENELLELRAEIQQDISIVNKLKRLTIAEEGGDERMVRELLVKAEDKNDEEGVKERNARKESKEQMQFVDNIYEFCDNNASMLV